MPIYSAQLPALTTTDLVDALREQGTVEEIFVSPMYPSRRAAIRELSAEYSWRGLDEAFWEEHLRAVPVERAARRAAVDGARFMYELWLNANVGDPWEDLAPDQHDRWADALLGAQRIHAVDGSALSWGGLSDSEKQRYMRMSIAAREM